MAVVAGWGWPCRKSKGGITELVSQGRCQPKPQPGHKLCGALCVTAEDPGAGLAPGDPLVPHLSYRGEQKLFQTQFILPSQVRETQSQKSKTGCVDGYLEISFSPLSLMESRGVSNAVT